MWSSEYERIGLLNHETNLNKLSDISLCKADLLAFGQL